MYVIVRVILLQYYTGREIFILDETPILLRKFKIDKVLFLVSSYFPGWITEDSVVQYFCYELYFSVST